MRLLPGGTFTKGQQGCTSVVCHMCLLGGVLQALRQPADQSPPVSVTCQATAGCPLLHCHVFQVAALPLQLADNTWHHQKLWKASTGALNGQNHAMLMAFYALLSLLISTLWSLFHLCCSHYIKSGTQDTGRTKNNTSKGGSKQQVGKPEQL